MASAPRRACRTAFSPAATQPLYFDELAKNGMIVEDAGPEFLAELQAIGVKMTAKWLETAGAEGQAIVDAYNAN